ncbi:MAG: hypothetical protein HFJ57_01905 [Clostridia bacterium]|nr:hypothetical protein [Clostridia bacterium]
MQEVIEHIREIKAREEKSLNDENEAIIDVIYYGKINLSKNDAELNNQTVEELYLVKKEVEGRTVQEFHTSNGVIATVGEEGQIEICEKYKQLINSNEFLLQLRDVMPLSLEKLEEEERKKLESTEIKSKKQIKVKEDKAEKEQYIENSKDAIINLDKKITETKTFRELVPELKEKGIVDVRVRRVDNTRFEFIGINNAGEIVRLESLEQTEGTNPNEDIIKVNEDGSSVEKEKTMTMLKIKPGENEQNSNEGFAITLGKYGIPEVSYYRRAKETDEYTSIPVNLKNTNQKNTDLEVRRYMEKSRNVTVDDNIKRANSEIEQSEDEGTTLDNIDDNPYNDTLTDEEEIMIQKAASRCKVSIESFKEELEKVNGETLKERIEATEEEINEQYIGNRERI